MDQATVIKIVGVLVSLLVSWFYRANPKINDKAVVPLSNGVAGQAVVVGNNTFAALMPGAGVMALDPIQDGAAITLAAQYLFSLTKSVWEFVKWIKNRNKPLVID